MRNLIIGDLHGSYKALQQVLEKASFNPEEDTLYSVGDIADGYPEVYECLSFLRALPDFHPVLGNHDAWLQVWLATGKAYRIWTTQGGKKTISSFERNNVSEEEKLDIARWMQTWPYVIVLENAIIMHGGSGESLTDKDIARLANTKRQLIEEVPTGEYVPTRDADILLWDRSCFRKAEYDERTHKNHGPLGLLDENKIVFTGHTEFGRTEPFISSFHNFINLDTMAGSYGVLTLMDMDTLEYWQSEKSKLLYPGYGPEYW